MALEADGEILVVDCGVTFPRVDLGIDTYRPDMSWLEERADAVKGLVLTHGHEDHIGAVPAFLDRFEVPVWGPEYALELAKLRLDEQGFRPNSYEMRIARPRGRFKVGRFEVEPVRVTHSIADATALVIRTPAGTVLHTGDFKLDSEPVLAEKTDEERLRDEGVRLLLSDSTNIDSVGWSGSEKNASAVLRNLIETAPGRVIVGLFASNVARLQTVGEIAASLGRKVVLLGRSVLTHARLGQQLGHLKWPSDLLLPLEALASTPRQKIVGIATGTQGERLAALAKLASRTHPHMQLDEGDRVVFSSRVIPGNEPVLSQMMNGFLRHGVQVCTATTAPGVHVSGHAYRDEQSKMIDLARPQSFVPIHGTLMHLHRHAELARERGIAEVTVLENGEVGELGDDRPLGRARGWVTAGKVATWGGDDIPERVLQDRELLARVGIALVTAVVDSRGRPVGPVALATRGVLDERLDADVLRETAREAQRALQDHPYHHHRPGDDEVAEVVRSSVRRKIESSIGRRPMVLAQVVRAK